MKSPSPNPAEQLIAHLEARTDSVAPEQMPASHLLQRFVEAGGKPGADAKIGRLIGAFRTPDDVISWLSAGGSPLLATKTKSASAFSPSIVPILGYRDSLLNLPSAKACFMRGEFLQRDESGRQAYPASQWKCGTTPEMVASSLLRAMAEGHLRQDAFTTGHIPAELLSAFRDPSVMQPVCELLNRQVPNFESDKNEPDSCLFTAASIKSTAFILYKNDLQRAFHALIQSPAYQHALTEKDQGLLSLFQACLEGKDSAKNITELFDYLEQYMDLSEFEPVIDDMLQQSAEMNFHFEVGAGCFEYLEDRFFNLEKAGRSGQAEPWITPLARRMAVNSARVDSQRKIYSLAYSKTVSSDPMVVIELLRKSDESAKLLLEAVSTEDIVRAFANAVKAHDVYNSGSLPLFDLPVDLLHGYGALDGMLAALAQELKSNYLVPTERESSYTRERKMTFVGHAAEFAAKAISKDYDQDLAKSWLAMMPTSEIKRKMMTHLPVDPALMQVLSNDERGDVLEDKLGL